MIQRKSRYRNATFYAVEGGSVMNFRLVVAEPPKNSSYGMIAGTRFDIWAASAYKDATKSWILTDLLEELCPCDAVVGDTTPVPPQESASFGEYGE